MVVGGLRFLAGTLGKHRQLSGIIKSDDRFQAATSTDRQSRPYPRPSVHVGSDCRCPGARAAAVPPFSGPRSRATLATCNAQPHQHRRALQTWGATANGACAPGAPPPPCASGVVCHGVARHPGAGAGGLGYGRRHHSRWPRRAHEQTVLMARRVRTENGAPRAWAGERTPSHLPVRDTRT